MFEPLVSIVIPSYNAEQWIEEAVKSALNQAWSKKEIIIVDDGSSDNTLSIAKRFESRSVKVLSQENQGASAARNKGLSIAQGDYIQWLDADDLLAPDKISNQLKVSSCESDLTLLSSSWARFFYQYKNAKFIPNCLWADLFPVDWMTFKFNRNAWMAIESWLVSRKITELAGYWNEKLLRDNDGEYFSRVVCASERIKFTPEAKSYCRTGIENSISSDLNLSLRKMESIFLSVSLQIKYLRSIEDSERTRSACLKYLQGWIIYFYPHQAVILEKANALANGLGGELSPPSLNWKYSSIQKVLGWDNAKRAQRISQMYKTAVRRKYEKIFYNLSITFNRH
jgi:glycosyltransferase involved in cell wall biosynthesis